MPFLTYSHTNDDVDLEQKNISNIRTKIVMIVLILGLIFFGLYIGFETNKTKQEALDNQFNSFDYAYIKDSINQQVLLSLDQQYQKEVSENYEYPLLTTNEEELSRSTIYEQWKKKEITYPISNNPSKEQGSVEIINSKNIEQLSPPHYRNLW